MNKSNQDRREEGLLAKSTSIDLEIFKHVATVTKSVQQAQMAQSFVLELLQNPETSHQALEFGMNGLLNSKAETFLSLSELPEEAYKQSKNALFTWAVLTKSLTDEIDDRTTVLCRRVATEHTRKLQDLAVDCVGSTEHDELIVMAVTVLICAVILQGEGDQFLLQFLILPWLSSPAIRQNLVELSPTLKMFLSDDVDEV